MTSSTLLRIISNNPSKYLNPCLSPSPCVWLLPNSLLKELASLSLHCASIRLAPPANLFYVCVCISACVWGLALTSISNSIPSHLRLVTGLWAPPADINMACVPVTTWQHVLDMWCRLSVHTNTHTHTHTECRLLKNRCINVHLHTHKHIKMPNRWRCNLPPVLKWEPRAGFGFRQT